MSDFVMPSLGADMDFGTLLEWKVQPGDHVERGQVIAVIETEKAAVEVEVFETGTIEDLVVTPGTKVAVGTVLAHIVGTGAPAPAASTPAPPPPAPAVEAPAPPPSAAEAPAPPSIETPLTPAPPAVPEPAALPAPSPTPKPATPQRVRVTPLARRRAEQLGVRLEGVTGTGIGGAITRDDVEAAAGTAGAAGGVPASRREPSGEASAEAGATSVERMRAAIGTAMARSKREIPHYYLEETIDLGAAMAWLDERNEHRPAHDRMLPVALFVRAVALAAVDVPALNGFWQHDHFEGSAAVHVGLAVSLRDEGLVAPAILDVAGPGVASKGLEQTMAELRDLAGRARRGALRGAEVGSATITVTSLGDQGVERVYGVIIPPQVAIVGFGKVSERPWARDGMVGAHPVVSATLSADHRASDGYQGARFLRTVAELLQHPEQL